MLPSPAPTSTLEPSHWDPLLIVVVGFICFFFLLFSFLKILKPHCSVCGITNVFRNRGYSRRVHGATIPDDPSFEFQSPGLNSFVIDSMPITQFNGKNEVELRRGYTECAVCLGEFEEGEWLKHLPRCSHVFHVSCIDTWFQTHPSCPICRSFVGNLSTFQRQDSVSMYRALLETLRRTEFHQERFEQYQRLWSLILQNSPQRRETRVAIRDV